ncbi:MAG: D-glycerate dehydrogenase [Myxococcales bacterium]|nr:D-glycerate dehydrogenase [Myxococcales bacterium]
MDRPRVFVTRDLPGPALERLRAGADCEVWPGQGAPPRPALLAGVRDAEGLLCLLTDPIDAELLAAAPRLQVISSCSVGLDHVDLAAASARGIPVGHTPGVLAETTADCTLALLLAAARRIPEADRFVRAGEWTPARHWEPDLLLGRDLHGSTVGLIGLGAIGQAVARRLAGFGCRVLAWTRSGRTLPGVEATSLEDLLAAADFVSLHVALTPETRDLLDADRLARMKPGAILVNAARGGLVDEAALAERLRSGALAAAALDVFAGEPLDPASPLLDAPNLVLAPHIGSASVRTRGRMAELAVDNLLAGLSGRPLPACANAAALGPRPGG